MADAMPFRKYSKMKKQFRIMSIRQGCRLLPALFLILAGMSFDSSLYARNAMGKAPEVHSPAPGTVERWQILEVMRVKVRELYGLDVIFVVKEMRVGDGWAWVHTLPRSKDGNSSYEDVYGLLHLRQGSWTVVEIPCTEPDNPECVDSPGYFRKLAARLPGLPPGILPGEEPER
jgi:hypothetical protein